jgi:hypothetical protein
MRLQDAKHVAVGVDHAHLGDADPVVYSNLETALLLTRIKAGTTQSHVFFRDLLKRVKAQILGAFGRGSQPPRTLVTTLSRAGDG